MPEPVESPAAALMRLTNGYQVSQAIHVAAELRLADFIGAEPVAAEEIAPRVGAHPRSLYRLLRALSTVGIFRETNDKRFAGSAISDLLRTDRPGSMWGWPAYIGRPHHRELWGDLLHSVRTGQDAPHHLWGVDIWQYRADKPEEIASFSAGMAAVSRTVAPAIIAAYDFSKFGRIVDVGGANGALLVAILSACPRSSGVVFDLPPVVREADSLIRTAGLDGRCEIVAGSYWDGVPAGGDAYIVKSVLMDNTDEEVVTLLRNVRSAIGPRGTLLVIERLIGAPNEGPVDAFFDLTMLLGTRGGVRRRDEWPPLFAAGGFSLESVTPTASWFYVVEGRPTT